MGNVYTLLLKTKLAGELDVFDEMKELFKIDDTTFNDWVSQNINVAMHVISAYNFTIDIPEHLIPGIIEYGKCVFMAVSDEEYRNIRCKELSDKPRDVAWLILAKLNYFTRIRYEDFAYYNLVKLHLDFEEAFEDLRLMINGILEGVI